MEVLLLQRTEYQPSRISRFRRKDDTEEDLINLETLLQNNSITVSDLKQLYNYRTI